MFGQKKSFATLFFKNGEYYQSITIDKFFPFKSPGTYCLEGCESITHRSQTKQSFPEWARTVSDGDVKVLSAVPATYHPRIWRGEYRGLSSVDLAGSVSNYTNSVVAADLIFKRLINIFSYVEPNLHNFNVYSHKLREVIILSCTEIESNWRAILTANGYNENNEKGLSTSDYVKLLEPMLLKNYKVAFPLYPEIAISTPFLNWSEDKPSRSIEWYAAYNKLKHDRVKNFQNATLKNAIDSVVALYVILCAQFGPKVIPSEMRVTRGFEPEYVYVPLSNPSSEINQDGSIKSITHGCEYAWNPQKLDF